MSVFLALYNIRLKRSFNLIFNQITKKPGFNFHYSKNGQYTCLFDSNQPYQINFYSSFFVNGIYLIRPWPSTTFVYNSSLDEFECL